MCQRPMGGSPSMSSGNSTMTSCPTTVTTAPPTGEHAASWAGPEAPSEEYRMGWSRGLHRVLEIWFPPCPHHSLVQDTQTHPLLCWQV